MPENDPSVIINKPSNPIFKIILVIIGVILLALLIGFLASKKNFQKNSTPTLSPSPTPSKISIICPTIATFCQNAKPVTVNNQVIAFASNLPKSTPIYAIFDGKAISRTVTIAGAKKEIFYSVTLTNSRGLKATYYFNQKGVFKNDYKSGEVLVTLIDTPIKYMDNNNFAFALFDKDNQLINLNQIQFK